MHPASRLALRIPISRQGPCQRSDKSKLSWWRRGTVFHSKTLPTDPWSIPQTPNQEFMKEFLSFGGERGCLGYAPGVCWGSLRILYGCQVSKIGGKLPQIIPFVHRVFHEINHPFWVFSPYFWKHPYDIMGCQNYPNSRFLSLFRGVIGRCYFFPKHPANPRVNVWPHDTVPTKKVGDSCGKCPVQILSLVEYCHPDLLTSFWLMLGEVWNVLFFPEFWQQVRARDPRDYILFFLDVEVRINGDRIKGLFHLFINRVFLGVT